MPRPHYLHLTSPWKISDHVFQWDRNCCCWKKVRGASLAFAGSPDLGRTLENDLHTFEKTRPSPRWLQSKTACLQDVIPSALPPPPLGVRPFPKPHLGFLAQEAKGPLLSLEGAAPVPALTVVPRPSEGNSGPAVPLKSCEFNLLTPFWFFLLFGCPSPRFQ